MDEKLLMDAGEFVRNDLRLRTFPVAVKFLKDRSEFPERVKRPSAALGKRITICQAVTMTRVYGWTVGLTREDLICVPAMIAFGFTNTSNQTGVLGKLFCGAGWNRDQESGETEVGAMTRLARSEYEAILLSPLTYGLFEPDTIAFYGNPAQVMRMIQGLVYFRGTRVQGNFGGKVECTEYLIAPFKSGSPRAAIPGMGDRIFSMTQDDEIVLALPGHVLAELVQGLKEAGKKVGARYPVTFYQNFQPEFPQPYTVAGKELGVL